VTDPSNDFIAREQAAVKRPREIYRIFQPPDDGTYEWRWTSHDQAITFDGQTYTPAPIRRQSLTKSQRLQVPTLVFSIDYLQDPITRFLVQWPVETIWVQIRRLFEDLPGEAMTIFLGYIGGVSITGRRADVECLTLDWWLRQQVPPWITQPQCNYFLYDDDCGVNSATYKVSTTVGSVDATGMAVTAGAFSGYDDHYFTWGWLKWGRYQRPIVKHTGSTIYLRYKLPGLAAGESIEVWPGCDLMISTCRSKFSNEKAHGGFPHIPVVNPVTVVPAPQTVTYGL
jgi:uncharacterized phage protein (TIGR02218 family)